MQNIFFLNNIIAKKFFEIINTRFFLYFNKMLEWFTLWSKFIVPSYLTVFKYTNMILFIETFKFTPRENLPIIFPGNEVVTKSPFSMEMFLKFFQRLPGS